MENETPTLPHTGSWYMHDDDCMCTSGGDGGYCNRGGGCWSCCGACKEDSDCSGANRHPTHWGHAKFGETIGGFREGGWPTFKSNAAIRAIAPEAFSG